MLRNTLLPVLLSLLILTGTSRVARAHYCDDGHYVGPQAREDCWWRYWTNNPTDADRLLSRQADDPPVAGNDRPDINILRVGDSGSVRGYSAPPHTAFGQLNPSTFTWQGTVHIITDLAINLSHQGRDDWALVLRMLPTQLPNAERLTLRVGDRWFNFSDANRDAGGLYWQGVRPNWVAGEEVEFGIHVFPDFFAPRAIDGSDKPSRPFGAKQGQLPPRPDQPGGARPQRLRPCPGRRPSQSPHRQQPRVRPAGCGARPTPCHGYVLAMGPVPRPRHHPGSRGKASGTARHPRSRWRPGLRPLRPRRSPHSLFPLGVRPGHRHRPGQSAATGQQHHQLD